MCARSACCASSRSSIIRSEELRVHLLFLHVDDVRLPLEAYGGGPMLDFGPRDRPLVDDGHDAFDDHRPRPVHPHWKRRDVARLERAARTITNGGAS
jgi:hypothetical protein